MPRAKVPSVFERRQAEKRPLDDLVADVAETSFRRVDRALAIPIERLAPSPDNPRTESLDENLQEFAASIAERGILQPLAVRRDPERAGYYYVIAGSRRLLAAQIVRMSDHAEERARVEELPCIVREGTPQDIFADALVENLARQDLSRVETMNALRRLQDEYGWSVRGIARRTGRSLGDISELLSVARDAELAPFVADETISPSAAVQIRRLPRDLRPLAIEAVQAGTLRKVKDVQRLRAQILSESDEVPGVVPERGGSADDAFVNEHTGHQRPPGEDRGESTLVFVNEHPGDASGQSSPPSTPDHLVTVAEHTRRRPGGLQPPVAYRPDDETVDRLARDVIAFLARQPVLTLEQVEVLRVMSMEVTAYLTWIEGGRR